MDKSYIDYLSFGDGIYTIDNFCKSIRSQVSGFTEWDQIEIEVESIPYEIWRQAFKFIGVDLRKKKEIEDKERAEYLRLHEKYGSTG
jgi:hypothetical protein